MVGGSETTPPPGGIIFDDSISHGLRMEPERPSYLSSAVWVCCLFALLMLLLHFIPLTVQQKRQSVWEMCKIQPRELDCEHSSGTTPGSMGTTPAHSPRIRETSRGNSGMIRGELRFPPKMAFGWSGPSWLDLRPGLQNRKFPRRLVIYQRSQRACSA